MKVKQRGRGITSSRPSAPKIERLNRVNNSNRPNQSRKGYYWTEPEDRALLENIKTKSINNIAKTYKRSKGAITARLLKLRPSYTVNHVPTRRGVLWSNNEDKTLLESIKEMGINNIAKTHNRTRAGITARLHKNHSRKSKSRMRELGQPLNEWLANTHANIEARTLAAIKTQQKDNVSKLQRPLIVIKKNKPHIANLKSNIEKAKGKQTAEKKQMDNAIKMLATMRNEYSPAYRGLSLSKLYDSDWKIPVEDQHKLIDVSIAKQKLRFHSVDRYDFTKPMDVNFIYDKQMVLLQDIDVKKVIEILNDPDVTSLLFLQPNV